MTAALAVLLCARTAAETQWPPEAFTNLKALPKDISRDELTALMAGFTRALGVRCTHCHVGAEGQPLSTFKFAADDKPAKQKARVMIEMVRSINTTHLPSLARRADPAVKVECATCHRGATVPRMLQDELRGEYKAGGLEAVKAKYRDLRERYYGRFTYDFGEVPLADVAGEIWNAAPEDGVQLHALNVEMNPQSAFAKRQHASLAITHSFRQQGIAAGTARYRQLRDQYGPTILTEPVLAGIGSRLLNANQLDLAIAACQLSVEAFPSSATTHEGLADAYLKAGDKARAIESFERALTLDPANQSAKEKLDKLRGG
jgi:tetratricopeptide (TPR) repeat protein